MTLLEFTIRKFIGPARRRDKEGRSHWTCPQCEDRTFYTMPPVPAEKDRYRCSNSECGMRGDIYDLLKFFDVGDYGRRMEYVKRTRKEFLAKYRPARSAEDFPALRDWLAGTTDAALLSQEVGKGRELKLQVALDDVRSFAQGLKTRTRVETAFRVLAYARTIASAHSIGVDALADACVRHLASGTPRPQFLGKRKEK